MKSWFKSNCSKCTNIFHHTVITSERGIRKFFLSFQHQTLSEYYFDQIMYHQMKTNFPLVKTGQWRPPLFQGNRTMQNYRSTQVIWVVYIQTQSISTNKLVFLNMLHLQTTKVIVTVTQWIPKEGAFGLPFCIRTVTTKVVTPLTESVCIRPDSDDQSFRLCTSALVWLNMAMKFEQSFSFETGLLLF